MEQHLRPVPSVESISSTEGETGEPSAEARSTPSAKAKSRPKKALPTDRMKFDVQKKALNAIGILSDGEEAITPADMAATLDLAPSSGGLNNAFFLECGLVTRAGKGRYKSTPAANDFARRFSFDPEEAGLALREPLSTTWFYETVTQHIRGFGPTPKEKLIELLAYKAETTKDYRVQLGTLLSWLEYAQVIEEEEGRYKLTDDATAVPPSAEGEAAEPESDEPSPNPEGATSASRTSSDQPVETILGFSFDFALTGDELAKLSPEQITALFKAVGEVMAIQAAAAD